MKSWYKSKTMWVNAIAVVGIVLQQLLGESFVIDQSAQIGILAVVNLVLRAITKEGLSA